MTLLLSIFFISLLSITVMFSRKLATIKNQTIEEMEGTINTLEVPYITEIKHITIHKTKRYGYIFLVITIRIYFRTKNLIRSKYNDLKNKIEQIQKSRKVEGGNQKEVSRFLKLVSDYKNKVRKIKNKIEEEEDTKN